MCQSSKHEKPVCLRNQRLKSKLLADLKHWSNGANGDKSIPLHNKKVIKYNLVWPKATRVESSVRVQYTSEEKINKKTAIIATHAIVESIMGVL